MKVLGAILTAVVIAAGGAGVAQAAPPLEVYGALPRLEQLEISPDGKRIAFVGTIDGVRALTVREVDGAILSSSPINKLKLRDIRWVGNDFVVVTNNVTEKFLTLDGPTLESSEVVVIDLKNKASYSVGSIHRVIERIYKVYGYRFVNGRWYGYFGGPYDNEVYQVDLETKVFEKVPHRTYRATNFMVGRDGAIAAHSDYNDQSGEWRMFVEESKTPALIKREGFGSSTLRGYSHNGDSIIIGPSDREDGAYYEVKTDGSNAVEAMALPADVRSMLFDPISGRMIGYSSGFDDETFVAFDARIQARVRGALAAFKGQSPSLISASADFGRLVMLTSGKEDPGTYWLVDIATGKARDLGLQYPIELKDVGSVRMVDYKAADGFQLHGVLTLPPGSSGKNLPVVIMPHGGPEARDYATFDWWAQAFASRGYAVFQPNFRGSSGYGEAYREAGFGEFGRKMQTDVSDGLAYLAKEGVVDPKRACIVGGSYGGYAALAGVTVQQGVYRCAVSYAGISDPQAMVRDYNSHSSISRYWERYMGAKGQNDTAAFRDISPMVLKDKVDAPILLIHGKDDIVVPTDQSKDFEKALKKIGKPVELILLENEDHYLSRGETRTAMLKASVAFVEKNNPPN